MQSVWPLMCSALKKGTIQTNLCPWQLCQIYRKSLKSRIGIEWEVTHEWRWNCGNPRTLPVSALLQTLGNITLLRWQMAGITCDINMDNTYLSLYSPPKPTEAWTVYLFSACNQVHGRFQSGSRGKRQCRKDKRKPSDTAMTNKYLFGSKLF